MLRPRLPLFLGYGKHGERHILARGRPSILTDSICSVFKSDGLRENFESDTARTLYDTSVDIHGQVIDAKPIHFQDLRFQLREFLDGLDAPDHCRN